MSKFINGTNRNQLPLFASSIDDAITQDNEIRLIDLFVDSLKLADFGFTFDFVENGRPAYQPSDLLKLFFYGYLNRMRSSRTLEKECRRNIELMWLLKGLVPDHNTIANFRKDNPKAIAYLKVLAMYFGTLRAIFKAFINCFILIIIKRLLPKRILIVV